MLHAMPTLNPRLTITLTPACAAVLREMSQLVGESQSAIVGGLLESSLPVFERVVQATRAAANIQDSARSEISAGLGRAQAKLEDQLGLMLVDMDDKLRPLLDEAEKVTRRSSGGAETTTRSGARVGVSAPPKTAKKGDSTPVPVTRGSGLTNPPKSRVSTTYSGLHPSTGERVLLRADEYFDKAGVLRTRKGKKNGLL